MQTNMSKTMTLIAACFATSVGLLACAESKTQSGPCGEGEAVDVSGTSFCVYKENIVIVGGFDCPASMPFRADFQRATVCSNRGFNDIDVPEDVCTRVFIPCVPVTDPNAGGCRRVTAEVCDRVDNDCDGKVDENCTDQVCGTSATCALPNTITECVDDTCEIVGCLEGFGDCDAQPANGCEDALDTLNNCGTCGAVCTAECCDQGICGQCDAPDAGSSVNCDEPTTEVCDAIDNDCDNLIDEGSADVLCMSSQEMRLCINGQCMFATCAAGFGDCNADPADGCETSLNTNQNCGACGLVCVDTVCVNGAC